MRRATTILGNRRGTALITCIIFSLVAASSVVMYSWYAHNAGRADVHVGATGQALNYADTGLAAARGWMRNPTASASLVPGIPLELRGTLEKGRYASTLYRATSDSLVSVVTTGYYHLPRGAHRDEESGRPAQMAVIRATVQMVNIAEYLAAVGTRLTISPGSDITDGKVYAPDLEFLTAAGLQTRIGSAYYLNSVVPNPPNAADVAFTQNPPAPQRLAHAPNLTPLDFHMRAYYRAKVAAVTVQADFSGDIDPPADGSNVFFVDGDITIGAAGPLNVRGSVLIYTTGQTTIRSDIVNSGGWLAVLSEKTIHIGASPGTPDTLTLNGTFITSGGINAAGSPRTAGTLTIRGGMVAQGGLNLSAAWPSPACQRIYIYQVPPNDLPLPNFANLMDYTVVRGRPSSY